MSNLVDKCRRHTGRTYPDGYGFALTYLSDDLNPAHLRDALFGVAADVYANGSRACATLETGRKDTELADAIRAYAHGRQPEDWLIEAAQALLGYALCGHPLAVNAMKLAGHPGY